MTKIRVMSENLANKIAAGEVVEKCASIVKELVENSIDAHANVIKVSLKEGGIKEIMVTDDGVGMEKEDAKLAFLRHATSKIYKDDDLFFINTLGFRGEALPSIASVSEVVLKTCATDVGTNVHIKGGALLDVSSSDAKKGTSIKITNLFYNTPARLKYLKSEQSELQNCVSYLEKLAISKPQISFSLENDDKILVKTSGSGNLLKTINEIYGLNVAKNMLEIKGSNDDFDIRGFVCKPEILRSNRNHIITIVNDRIVKNAELNKAINDAYYTYKPESKYPIVVICIDTDPTLIDVNIHPTKQDIKLSKINVLTELIGNKIKDALYQNLLIKNVSVTKEVAPVTYENKEEQTISNIKEVESVYQQSMEFDYQDVSIKEDETHKEKNEAIKTIDLKTVGIAHATYIMAQNDEGIYLIDQHAAQERINYEKYLKALQEEKVFTTDMLFPIKIEYSPSEYLTLKEQNNFITSLGFQIEEFGINTILVKAHPTWLLAGHEEESIRKIFDLILINKNNFDRVKYNEKIAITLACKMSIKANMRITLDDADRLLQDLVKCDNPYNCPHGRPTIIKFTIYELEKMFKRVMN
ncbi:MAG: DNA mismatch repair endonuclease MutL [Bacilli bacterium]|nr:DNA mismatch repair endonuclease MutL [Bacilli bacterium]